MAKDGVEAPTEAVTTSERKPFEQWAAAKQTAAWLLAGMKNAQGWAIGREVSETEYDAATQAALDAKMMPG